LSLLQELIVARCSQITDDTILAMTAREIVELHLGGCLGITDVTLRFVSSHWPRLSKLNLERCDKISDQGVACLSVLTQLRRLNLAHCLEVSDSGVAPLRSLTQLQHLALEGTRVTRQLALTFPKFVASHLQI